MRLVHITTVPQSLSFLEGQVSYMKSRGFEVHALSSPGEDLTEFGEREGVEVHASEMPRRITPGQDIQAIRRISSILKEIRPHIVHSHTPKGGLLGTLAAWRARVPVRIYHIHGLPLMTATGSKRTLLTWSEKTASRFASRVLCVSHSVREAVVEEGLCPARKVKVLLDGSINGVDSDVRFNPARLAPGTRNEVRERHGIPADAVVVGFVGRIVRDKGLVELARAWKFLRESHPELHLIVAGPFEPQDPIPQEVEESLRSDPRVHLVGPERDMPPLYTAMDIVVLPTYREGFPLVPMEAASMGLPVVATRIPGCVDAVEDGVTGSLVPPRDAAALAASIEAYVKSPGLRWIRGQAGRERMVRQFRQVDMWDAVYQEYCRLLTLAGLRAPDVQEDQTEWSVEYDQAGL